VPVRESPVPKNLPSRCSDSKITPGEPPIARLDYAPRVGQAYTAPHEAPLVTVAIPCHNEVGLLANVLAGMTAQRGGTGDLEIILVDNNSDDPGLERLAARYRETLGLRLVRQPPLEHPMSLCRARNRALALARGTWFWTLDADCIPNPGYLAAVRTAVDERREPRLMLTGERIFVDGRGLSEDAIIAGNGGLHMAPRVRSDANYGLLRDRRFPFVERLPHVEHPWDHMHGGNTFFRTDVAREVGGYDEGFDGNWGYEDDEFAYRMISRGGSVPQFDPGLSVYHQEPTTPPSYDRLEKAANPNWHRVCSAIPGYRDYKLAGYRQRGVEIRVGV
jgi:glycosyltransferase involved in cell wall biosynthesis